MSEAEHLICSFFWMWRAWIPFFVFLLEYPESVRYLVALNSNCVVNSVLCS